MYLRLLAESVRRGTRRKLLAVTSVALGTLGAVALGEVLLASGDRLAAEMGSYGANIEVQPAEGAATLPVADLSRLSKIFWRNNLVAVAPLLEVRVRLAAAASSKGEPVVAPLIGTWFDHPLEPRWRTGLPATRPTLKITGRWPHDNGEAVLGRRLAARLGAPPGTVLEAAVGAQTLRLRVVGIAESGGAEDEQAFAPLAALAALTGQPGRYTRAEVFALTNPETGNVRDPAA